MFKTWRRQCKKTAGSRGVAHAKGFSDAKWQCCVVLTIELKNQNVCSVSRRPVLPEALRTMPTLAQYIQNVPPICHVTMISQFHCSILQHCFNQNRFIDLQFGPARVALKKHYKSIIGPICCCRYSELIVRPYSCSIKKLIGFPSSHA